MLYLFIFMKLQSKDDFRQNAGKALTFRRFPIHYSVVIDLVAFESQTHVF